MLMLTRKRGERVLIRVPSADGPPVDIWVAVLDMDPGKVRLGFLANPKILIAREEILEKSESGTLTIYEREPGLNRRI